MQAPDFAPMTPLEARFALRAMRQVAASDGGMSDEERALLTVSSELLTGGEGAAARGEAAKEATPEEAASVFEGEAARRRLIQLLIVTGMMDNDFCAEELAIVDAFTAALGAPPEWVDRMRRFTGGHLLLMRLDIARRVPAQKPIPTDSWTDPGLSTAWDFMRGAARVTEDISTAWRYKKLGLLPRGTLGREYWTYMTSRRFLLPGERGSSLAGTAYHDFIHALCGYDTDATGEAEVTAFTAGMLKIDDPLALVLGSLSMRLLGSRLAAHESEGAAGASMQIDYDRIGLAHAKGRRATAELTERWDYWSVVDQPIEALLARYGIQTG